MVSVIGGVLGAGVGALGVLGGLTGSKPSSPYDFSVRRAIHNKSYIEFHFPNKLVARLPFYENIDIRESREANIVKYDPIGRSSSLYTYTGATSRVLKLDFFLTLPHIQDMHVGPKVRFQPGEEGFNTKEEIKKYMKDPKGANKVFKEDDNTEEEVEAIGVNAEPTNWVKYVAWWVNLIRSSVLNNQQDVTQGPPLIRLKHGELYDNIPCICKSYNIASVQDAGRDVKSLLSRRIKVSMDLEEYRAGNFGEYNRQSKQILDRDNVAGWEAIIGYSTTDPGSAATRIIEREWE